MIPRSLKDICTDDPRVADRDRKRLQIGGPQGGAGRTFLPLSRSVPQPEIITNTDMS